MWKNIVWAQIKFHASNGMSDYGAWARKSFAGLVQISLPKSSSPLIPCEIYSYLNHKNKEYICTR